jgi:adenine-specific DNA-methyltransferase
MIVKTRARYVFLSYNSEGIVARADILSMMRWYGEVDVKSKRYPRFRANTDGANRRYKADNVNEYLFRLRKWS